MTPQVPAPQLLNLNLSVLDSAKALALSDNVTSSLKTNPFFSNIPLDPLLAAEARLKDTFRATSAGNYTLIPQRDADLSALVKELTRVGFNVQLLAIDEEHQLHKSGFEMYKRRPRTKAPHPPLTALSAFEVVNGKDEKTVYLNAVRQLGAFGYQFQYTDQDPTVEANWVEAITCRGCNNVQVQVPESLKRYTFRGRPLGDDGPGPWSAHVTISVT